MLGEKVISFSNSVYLDFCSYHFAFNHYIDSGFGLANSFKRSDDIVLEELFVDFTP